MAGAMTVDKADRIMSKINYSRGMSACDPNSGETLECWYSNSDIEAFSIMVAIRLSDAAFRFQYIPRLGSTMTKLQTEWFSPVTNKKHFMKWFRQFYSDAYWFSKKYSDVEDDRIYEDAVIMIDKAMIWGEWDIMKEREKIAWCKDFGFEHRHVIPED